MTTCQAKVYLASIQTGTTTPKTISEFTRIPRPYIYGVVGELEKLGLIERRISKKLAIEAVPLKIGISYLVQRKKQKIRNIIRGAEKLLRDFKEYKNQIKVQDYTSQFIWLSEREPYMRKRREEIDNSKKSINFVTSWKRIPLTAFTFGETAEKALKRKVKIRVVMEIPPKKCSLPKIIEKLEEYPNYDLRYIPNPPKAVIGVFDEKRIIIDASSSAGLAECPALWSNNPSFLAAMQDYFEILWVTSLKEEQYDFNGEQFLRANKFW